MNYAPVASSVALLAVAKGYCTAAVVDAPLDIQLQTAAILGASHFVSELGTSGDPLNTALSTGALFTAAMFLLGDRAIVRNGVLGVALSYIAETALGISAEETNEGEGSSG